MEDLRRTELERATLRVYAQPWNGHALPRLGRFQLRELTAAGHSAGRARLSDGQLKALKNRRQLRTVELLAPLREDLEAWRAAAGSRAPTAPLFANHAGGFWRATDWRSRVVGLGHAGGSVDIVLEYLA